MRTILSPTADVKNIKSVVPVNLGGTAAIEAEAAAIALSAVPVSDIGQIDGVAKMSPDMEISLENMPAGILNYATIDGPENIYVNQSVNFKITNFDAKSPYTVSVNFGNVVRVGDILIYTAPSIARVIELTVNNRTVKFNVQALAPKTPTIVSPIQAASKIGSSVVLTSSAFFLPFGNQNHQYTDWEVATDREFTDLVFSKYDDATNKLDIVVTGLVQNTIYFTRVRHKDLTYGHSEWSVPSVFQTKPSFTALAETAVFTQATPNTSPTAFFGYDISFSADGTRVAVGAYQSTEGNNSTTTGVVHVFRKTNIGWVREQIISPLGGANHNGSGGSAFGTSVKMNATGDMLAVGSPNYDNPSPALNDSGAVYIFTRSGNTWTRQTVLFANDLAAGARFGNSLDSDPGMTRLVVGADGVTVSSQTGAGAAYVFFRTGGNWSQEAKLVSGTPVANGFMGLKVKMSADGNRVMTSCAGETVSSTSASGAVYMYVRNGATWSQEQRIVSTTQVANQYFGRGFAIDGSGTYAFIGVPGAAEETDSTNGKVMVYKRTGSTWAFLNQFSAESGSHAKNNSFGRDIAIDGSNERLVISARRATVGGLTNVGRIFHYQYKTEVSTKLAELAGSNSVANSLFGWRVAISRDSSRIASSAWINTPGDNGMAYLFE